MNPTMAYKNLKPGTRFKNDQFTQTYQKINDDYFVDVEHPDDWMSSDLIYEDDRLEIVE